MARGSAATATARQIGELFGVGATAGVDDGRLLARYAATGDGRAFAALVDRHGPMVLATARAVLKHEHDSEDAFQATFLILARRAGTVRGTDALGGWLHRVAYRAAVQASVVARRRRERESGGSVLAVPDESPSGPDFDLKAILHEEIDRLPESRRLPVVLCDLEGLTYDEAARQLGWTVATLRSRLARARQRLRARLTGRGVTAPAVVLAARGFAGRSVVSNSLTGSAASAGARVLSQIVLKGMFMNRLQQAATVLLAALAVGSAGFVASGKVADRPGEAPPRASSTVPPVSPVDAEEDAAEIQGRVVGPDGRPVAGATIRPSPYDTDAPVPQTTSGPDGQFSLRLPRTPKHVGLDDPERFPYLVASAPGFGPHFVAGALRPGGPGFVTIRLVEAGPPVEGRIVDLEGRAVARVKVAAQGIYLAPGENLGPWVARVAGGVGSGSGSGSGLLQGLSGLDAPTQVTETDASGRFRLTNLGRDRVVTLIVSGPTLATSRIHAMTRPGPEVRFVEDRLIGKRTFVVHGTRFDLASAPSRPVRGVVRDATTGRPVVGARIQAAEYDRSSRVPTPSIVAITDAEGRYDLPGLPRAESYRIFVRSFAGGTGLGYVGTTLRAPASTPGLTPVTFDFSLRRGVVVRGRVTDQATGRPVAGHVNAYAFVDNPHVADFPGYSESLQAFGYLDSDGRYEIVTPPGRGIIACRSDMARYRTAVGSEAIIGPRVRDSRTFATLPRECYDVNYHVLAGVDLDPKLDSATVDLQVDPGRSLDIAVLDPEGRPLGGTVAEGWAAMFASRAKQQDSPTVTVHSLIPGKPRRVTVKHLGRKLIGSIYLKGDEIGPLTLSLRPWGEIIGRIIDDQGKGRPGLGMYDALGDLGPVKVEEVGDLPGGSYGGAAPVGEDGRFHIVGLVPGLQYGASVVEKGEISIGNLFVGVITAPGEVKDLGDMKVMPFKQQ